MENIIYKVLPKQMEFLKSKKRSSIFVGSYGAGKSVATCMKLLQHAVIPNNVCLLTRKTRSALVMTTLRTLLIGDNSMPPILPYGTYTHNESKSTINIHGGGTIIYRGADDIYAIRSLNLGCVACDEIVELSEEEWDTLTSRLRHPADPNQQIFGATNPESPNHWLYNMYLKNKDTMDMITATIDDNPRLPPQYVTDQKQRYTGSNYKRYILGEWSMNSGAVYKEFNNGHKINKSLEGFQKFIISVDVGYTNDLTSIIVSGLESTTNKLHAFEEFAKNDITPSEIVSKIDEISKKYPNNVIVIDPSSAGIRLDCEKLGLNIDKANNNIEEGIKRVSELLSTNCITFDNSCSNIFKEFDLYSYKEGSDKPIDRFNHSMDSLRYNIAYYFDNYRIYSKPSLYIPSKNDLMSFDDDE